MNSFTRKRERAGERKEESVLESFRCLFPSLLFSSLSLSRLHVDIVEIRVGKDGRTQHSEQKTRTNGGKSGHCEKKDERRRWVEGN
jgi:hypothetical protein